MEEEQIFRDNEKLVYLFAAKKRLNSTQHDYEDILQHLRIGLLKAIRSFKPELGFKLTTYAMKCINNEFNMYYRNGNAFHKKTVIMSLSNTIDTDDGEIEFMETIKDTYNLEDDAAIREALSKLNEKECRLLILFQSKKQKEIAKEMRHTQKHISALKQRLIDKIVG